MAGKSRVWVRATLAVAAGSTAVLGAWRLWIRLLARLYDRVAAEDRGLMP
jgi:hypothetical protein